MDTSRIAIRPQSSVALGDTIRNSAAIYFDANPVVRTRLLISDSGEKCPGHRSSRLVTGLQGSYCSNAGVQKGRIGTNLPAAGSKYYQRQ